MKNYAVAITLIRAKPTGGIDLETISAVVDAEEPENAMHRGGNVRKVTDLTQRGYFIVGMALTEINL